MCVFFFVGQTLHFNRDFWLIHSDLKTLKLPEFVHAAKIHVFSYKIYLNTTELPQSTMKQRIAVNSGLLMGK